MKTKTFIWIVISVIVIVGIIFFAQKIFAPGHVEESTNGTSYTLSQVAMHNSVSSCWTTINGAIYDVTSWISQHPGGLEAILSLCGIDGSSAFNGQHGGQMRPEQELASFKIGTLSK